MGRTAISVPVPAIWAEQCPSDVYEGFETGNDVAETKRNSLSGFSGRPPDSVPVCPGIGGSGKRGVTAVTGSGICNQLGEITVEARADHCVSRVSGKLPIDDIEPTGGETPNHHCRMQTAAPERNCLGEGTSQSDWTNDSFTASNSPSSSVLQESSEIEECGFQDHRILRDQSEVGPQCQGGVGMVDHRDSQMEWEVSFSNSSGLSSGDRCFSTGVGSFLGRSSDRRPLVRGREELPYQSSRADGGSFCGESLCKAQEKPSCQIENGQHDGCCILKPHGGNTVPGAESVCLSALAVVPPAGYYPVSRASSRQEESSGRQRVQDSTVICRVDASPPGICSDHAVVWSMRGGSICKPFESPVANLCKLASRSLCDEYRCLQTELVKFSRLCFPTILSNWTMSTESITGRVSIGVDNPSMASSALVPSTIADSGGTAVASSTVPKPTDRPVPTESSPCDSGQAGVSRLESIRVQHKTVGVSDEASTLITAGWSKGTNRTYQSAWKKWCGWCDQQKVDPISCDVKFLVNFLAELFKQGLQHRSINTVRSAVSMTHNQVEGVPIGQHPLISRLMRGVYNSRPPQPRYSLMWDVEVVVQYIKKLGSNRDLSLKSLSRKLAMLMVLVNANRSSELGALDVQFRVFRPEGVVFKLPSLTKKRSPGTSPKELFFGAFPHDNKLCVVECLRVYEERTKSLRVGRGGQQSTKLFLSYVKPHKPVTSQRIAHWLKDLLQESGIDTDQFKAHSIRGASATAACERGVHLDQILSTADWSKDSTFRRFYYRPVHNTDYAEKVLSVSH